MGSGAVSIIASNLSKEMVESATKASLVAHLEIDRSLVTVMATQKRRLKEVTPARRFADEWSIAYTITAPTSKMAALQSKATAIENDSTSFSASMKSELMKAGASSAEASITVSSFTGKVDTTSATEPEVIASSSDASPGLTAMILVLVSELLMHP